MANILTWLTPYYDSLILLGMLSAGLFIFSLLLMPWLICRIPFDYFQRPVQPLTWRQFFSPLTVLRNLVGGVVLLAGIAMLVLPGQGILTIILGIAIMQFSGKERLERQLLAYKGVLSAINWIRRKNNVPELPL